MKGSSAVGAKNRAVSRFAVCWYSSLIPNCGEVQIFMLVSYEVTIITVRWSVLSEVYVYPSQ